MKNDNLSIILSAMNLTYLYDMYSHYVRLHVSLPFQVIADNSKKTMSPGFYFAMYGDTFSVYS